MKSKECAKLLNTLTILLKGLEGKVTTIELRNESSIRGRIDSVDYLMNITLTDAVVVAPDGRQLLAAEEFFVQVSIMLRTLSRFNCIFNCFIVAVAEML